MGQHSIRCSTEKRREEKRAEKSRRSRVCIDKARYYIRLGKTFTDAGQAAGSRQQAADSRQQTDYPSLHNDSDSVDSVHIHTPHTIVGSPRFHSDSIDICCVEGRSSLTGTYTSPHEHHHEGGSRDPVQIRIEIERSTRERRHSTYVTTRGSG